MKVLLYSTSLAEGYISRSTVKIKPFEIAVCVGNRLMSFRNKCGQKFLEYAFGKLGDESGGMIARRFHQSARCSDQW